LNEAILTKICDTNFTDLISTVYRLQETAADELIAAANQIVKTFENGGKLLICGNGGSAADSQHLAAEFISSFSKDLKRKSLPAISIASDVAILTAYSNDFNFTGVFERQVEALGNSIDTLIVFSTSGNSENCIKALEKAKLIGMGSIAFTGASGFIGTISDFVIGVPSTNTQHIQECHQICYHILVELVEYIMFRNK
jgi:D-sedoheptulose 7-phosphate isomerase